MERTLTINDVGLTFNNDNIDSTFSPNKTRGKSHPEKISPPQGIGNHHYIHNTPVDYVKDSVSHLQDVHVENYDDFYSFKDNLVQVQDQRGWFVMYDVALSDFM